MSITKRYIESLPEEEQNEILGAPPIGEDEANERETDWLADERRVRQFMAAMDMWLERRQ